ncbi:nose resistant to fluoxetine protein 6-like [Diadema antillarum]|uniref:nose resistant to fluoxetine protein 6-like n=1 Tax=Diadema antillarum TaxID=105358 RepID=UPI003A85E390
MSRIRLGKCWIQWEEMRAALIPPQSAPETTPLMDDSSREHRRKRKEKAENFYSGVATFPKSFTFQPIQQGFYFVDAFFLLSGFLLTYLTLKRMKASDGKMDWIWFYLHRHFRLTPALAMLMLIWMFIFPEMNQGPFWYRTEENIDSCRRYWWTDILYINNFFPTNVWDQCIGWAWYLACDMQFYYLSPLLLIPLYRFPKIGLGAVTATCIASFITTAVIVWENDFQIPDQCPEILYGDSTRVNGENKENTVGPINTMNVVMSCTGYAILPWKTAINRAGNTLRLNLVYDKPYCRVSPYLVGMMLGYLMQRIGKRKLTLKSVVVAGGWITAIILYMVVIYGLYNLYRGASTSSLAARVMYITFSRFIFALALAWIIFACHYGYGGVVSDFLSWRFWTPLSRLTYSTYLLHPVLQNVYGYGSATPIHWSIFNYIIFSAAFISLSYFCALAMCLLVEFPFINLGKMLMTEVKGVRGNGKRKR